MKSSNMPSWSTASKSSGCDWISRNNAKTNEQNYMNEWYENLRKLKNHDSDQYKIKYGKPLIRRSADTSDLTHAHPTNQCHPLAKRSWYCQQPIDDHVSALACDLIGWYPIDSLFDLKWRDLIGRNSSFSVFGKGKEKNETKSRRPHSAPQNAQTIFDLAQSSLPILSQVCPNAWINAQ